MKLIFDLEKMSIEDIEDIARFAKTYHFEFLDLDDMGMALKIEKIEEK